MQVAVADDPGVVCGGGEVFGGSLQVVPPDGGSLCGKASEEVVDVCLTDLAGELAVKSVDRAPVKRSGGFGEQVGQSSQQGRSLPDRGGGAESGEQRLAGDEVHQAPGATQVEARPGGAADGRHREPVSREVALHGGLERGGGGVGHDPGDEATIEIAWCVSEFDVVHLGPEPAGQRYGWTRPRHGGSVRGAAQRGEQAVGGRVGVCDHEAPDVSRRAERRRGG